MEMPKLTKQHKKLESFVGKWKGEEKMHPGPWCPEGGTGTGVIKSKLDLDGFFLVMDYAQKQGTKTVYKGRGIFGYDAHKNAYSMNWFDSMGGGAEPAYGPWDGKKLVLESKSPMGHHRCTFAFPKKDVYTFLMEMSQDGQQWTPSMEARYQRQGE